MGDESWFLDLYLVQNYRLENHAIDCCTCSASSCAKSRSTPSNRNTLRKNHFISRQSDRFHEKKTYVMSLLRNLRWCQSSSPFVVRRRRGVKSSSNSRKLLHQVVRTCIQIDIWLRSADAGPEYLVAFGGLDLESVNFKFLAGLIFAPFRCFASNPSITLSS